MFFCSIYDIHWRIEGSTLFSNDLRFKVKHSPSARETLVYGDTVVCFFSKMI